MPRVTPHVSYVKTHSEACVIHMLQDKTEGSLLWGDILLKEAKTGPEGYAQNKPLHSQCTYILDEKN